MPPPSPRPSQASLTALLAAAQRANNPKCISLAQLQRYTTQWFPRELWRSAYGASLSDRVASSSTRTLNPFLRFCRNPPRVSPEWTAALQLVALSYYVSDPAKCTAAHSPTGARDDSPPSASPTIQTIEHLLRFGVFPPTGWSVTLALLDSWRREQQKQSITSSHASPSAGLQPTHTATATSPSEKASQLFFPAALQAPAMAQLLHHISLAPPSPERWQDALRLYQLCAAQTYTSAKDHHTWTPLVGTSGAFANSAPATSAFLKALRHMTITTLLQAGEWERGLYLYYHSLYQRDLPGTVTTGYLVQALGRAEKWAAALQVYELCVKLLHAQREMRLKSDPSRSEAPSRSWGTTLSMAMAAVQCCPTAPPTALLAMVQRLERQNGHSDPSSSLPPLVQLDGNFLAAVQALAREEDRVAVLRYAKREGLLDTFKLIRGLLSKHRWEEALLLFTEAMKVTAALPSPGPGGTAGMTASAMSATARGKDKSWPDAHFSRREIGETRLNFLHSSSIHSVSAVVEVLNRHRNDSRRRSKEQMVGAAARDTLALNDQEVECVLSKTLEVNEAAAAESSRAADFWQYCLQLLDHNYASLNSGPSPCTDSTSAGVTSHRSEEVGSLRSAPQALPASSPCQRRPTAPALSFLLRHPRLPWQAALRLINAYDLLDVSHDGGTTRRKGRGTRSAVHNVGRGERDPAYTGVSPRALALSAAVERLTSQGRHKDAEDLALRALEVEVAASRHSRDGVSLPASLLQVVSLSTLQELLLVRHHDGLFVEKRVLFHLLRESVSACGNRNLAMSQRASFEELLVMNSGERFVNHPCGRALAVTHLLMQGTVLPRGCSADKAARPLLQLPDSLFLLDGRSPRSTEAPHRTAEMPPPVPWLLVYPPAVHCEVIRVIQCMTPCTDRATPYSRDTLHNSADNKAQAWDVQRWTWTMRYLRTLADAFAGLQRRAPDPSRDAPGHLFLHNGSPSAVEQAKEAYYVATFEAVISLLETTAEAGVPSSAGRATLTHCGDAAPPAAEEVKGLGVEGETGGIPCTPRQRIQVLCQLLERAVARYGCAPPTHMLLPNQLDRLLPPLVKRTTLREDKSEIPQRQRDGARCHVGTDAQERCTVAACLVRLIVHSLGAAPAQTHPEAGTPRPLCAVEPALLHNALKLCCRVAEYRRELSFALPQTMTDITADCAALCEAGRTLVRLQCERCGLSTVRPGTLSLLYHLCAAVEACSSHDRPSLPKKVALEATEYLLRLQASRANTSSHGVRQRGRSGVPAVAPHADESEPGQGPLFTTVNPRGGERDRSERAPLAVVQTHHCDLFFFLFGWEGTLHVWYPAFPRHVLRQLSGDPLAIEICLNLEEHVRGR
ncbi:hypothetical protein ABL78_5877 [Leptomonas seymouri]|uniref:Uncharacterized protein n=1 Tax=Leptomonas seymouri TaxID=5684 RepID=A0A0N1I473_LEPSE|nr:hypothetical protein ABL78_5877 [Leptomonas seymouri]|eukprot:KPI85072.1 hypothetical protein ABL78_5877 [Leptomonas seymouri]